ncbi:MAG: Asp23/Gls24 family envelope stress response protein [Oscillospiraceae bacterium]|nr:Asp23/Gls24 family envelope stress response protein [Oscillospiraceae bacterium]
MDKVQTGERSIQISEDVLRNVAALAVRDVEGVAGLAGNRASLRDLLVRPVEVENLGGAIAVDVRIILKNGYRAVQVAKQVQLAVKQSIQDMTGVTAVNVDVEVTGVDFEE